MAALAPALEEASAPAVLARLDGDIRGVIEEFRGEAESLVSTLGPGAAGGLLLEEGGGDGGAHAVAASMAAGVEGGPGAGDVVPEGETAARLTRECGACIVRWCEHGACALPLPSSLPLSFSSTQKSDHPLVFFLQQNQSITQTKTVRAHARTVEGEARRLARLRAKGLEERREVTEYWAGCVQSLRCVLRVLRVRACVGCVGWLWHTGFRTFVY